MAKRKKKKKRVDLDLGTLLKGLGFATYTDYLKGQHWLNLRRRMTLKPIPCRGCGKFGWIVLHHVSYRNLGHELPSDLLPLCDPCHEKVHVALDAAYPGRPVAWKAERTPVLFPEWFPRSKRIEGKQKKRSRAKPFARFAHTAWLGSAKQKAVDME